MKVRSANLAALALWIGTAVVTTAGTSPLARANPTVSPLSVDIRDVAELALPTMPEAPVLLDTIRTSLDRFFPQDVKKIYGIELLSPPVRDSTGTSRLSVVALVRSDSQSYFFRKLEVTLSGNPLKVTDVKTIDADLPLNKTRFSARVGLLQRKLILEDRLAGIRKIYPLGVGGFDEGVTAESRSQIRLLTPLFKNATLNRKTAIAKRFDPAYYQGLPFIPISNSRGTRTSIAFHIIQHPKMIRGFDSHGCMRLRKKDLHELHAILMNGGETQIPVEIFYQLPEQEDHPYPLSNNKYMRVKNFGTRTSPISRRDGHNLIIMESRSSLPPIAQLPFESTMLSQPLP